MNPLEFGAVLKWIRLMQYYFRFPAMLSKHLKSNDICRLLFNFIFICVSVCWPAYRKRVLAEEYLCVFVCTIHANMLQILRFVCGHSEIHAKVTNHLEAHASVVVIECLPSIHWCEFTRELSWAIAPIPNIRCLRIIKFSYSTYSAAQMK